MTRQFFAKRYAILKERAETHLHKHVASMLINRHGEEEALRRLERTGVICAKYIYDFDVEERVILSRNDDDFSLEPRRIVRVIGMERDRPLLSRISEQAKFDTLFTIHRLPDKLAMLVDEFADYGGLQALKTCTYMIKSE